MENREKATEVGLELMPSSRAVLSEREDLGAFFRHQQRMFELRRWSTVFCADGPSVDFVTARVPRPCIDHWFDGKAHAGVKAIDSALPIREVGNRRVEVKLSSQAMPNVFAYDSETAFVCFGDNRFTNRADATSRGQRLDGKVETVECALCDRPFFFGHFVNQKRLALVTVPAVHHCRDVDVDDVTRLELVVVRDAVANDVVDTRAATLGVVLVAEGGRFVTVIHRPGMNHFIDLPRRDSRFHVRAQVVHQLCVDSTGTPHRVLLFGIQDQLFLLLQHHDRFSVAAVSFAGFG